MTGHNGGNPMVPSLGRLSSVKDLGADIKLIGIELHNGGSESFLNYKPGQFVFLSAFGIGEAPFGIASTPQRTNRLEFAVQRLGSVTTELHELSDGDTIGIRGPLGNWFPMDDFKNKNILVIGGGIGGAPLRPVIQTVIDNRPDYGHFTILWAARHPSLLVFTDEYDEWRAAPDTELHLTVDQPDPQWNHHVGLVTELLEQVAPSPDRTISITCGPPIMIYYVNELLVEKFGFSTEQNYVTLEARMHCGIGKCGRCNIGEKFVCTNGPVFSMAQVNELKESFL